MTELDPRALEAAARALSELHIEASLEKGSGWRVAAHRGARAAVTAYLAEAGDGWMPIETAPKNAQLILGHSEQRWIRFGRFYPEFRKWYYSGTNERQQYSETEGGVPTHWMPLPTPPAAQEKK